jgi:hypothetical protein
MPDTAAGDAYVQVILHAPSLLLLNFESGAGSFRHFLQETESREPPLSKATTRPRGFPRSLCHMRSSKKRDAFHSACTQHPEHDLNSLAHGKVYNRGSRPGDHVAPQLYFDSLKFRL